jgi:HSP20 family protein
MKEIAMALPVRRSTTSAPVTERWNPISELDDLHSRMEQLIQGVWSDSLDGDGAVWVPPVDIEETEDAWVVEADVPGVDRRDINVEVRDSELTISGEIKEQERRGVLRRRTRRRGRFEYRVTLPAGADREGIDASLDEGVLRVRIPKSEESRPRRIDVKSG